jgi:hypothetical protein
MYIVCVMYEAMYEWRLYMTMDVPAVWHSMPDGHSVRIDQYWNHVFQSTNDNGRKNFRLLPVVVKPLLCLAHGNADPERGFSVNKRLLTSDRSSLSEASINGLRTLEDVVRRSGGVTKVPLTRDTLNDVRNAASLYRQRIETERLTAERNAEKLKQAEELRQKNDADSEVKKKDVDIAKKALMDDDKQVNETIKTAEMMITNANDSLKQAIKCKDMCKAELAQAMIQAAQKKLTKAKLDAKRRASLVQQAFGSGITCTQHNDNKAKHSTDKCSDKYAGSAAVLASHSKSSAGKRKLPSNTDCRHLKQQRKS